MNNIESVSKITSIILCNYPFFMNDLEDLQSNWNVLEKIIDEILTEDVYKTCLSISPIMDLFIPWNTKWNFSEDIGSFISINYSSIMETFKVRLKTLFAKTNKVLIKVNQNYPEKIKMSVFSVFTEKTSDKLLNASSLDDLMKTINQFNTLYLMSTSSRANIWKDEKYNIPGTSFNFQQWNVEFATIIFMNSIFSYYGSFNESGGKCFSINFSENQSFDIWDMKTFKESTISGIPFTISIDDNTMTFKNGSIELKKYENTTLLISELLLNNQNPFDVNYEMIPNISASLYTFDDIQQYAEDYRKQSNRSWLTFSDVLIGFDENDTYTNQTFKRSIYNFMMRKVCNWTLFIPLNTFFDCSNINRIHEEYGIKMKPSDLTKYDEINPTFKKLDISELSESIKEIHERATKLNQLGNTLKINTMTMSNPPTDTEITKYKSIEKNL